MMTVEKEFRSVFESMGVPNILILRTVCKQLFVNLNL
jgi:hypothetical protein